MPEPLKTQAARTRRVEYTDAAASCHRRLRPRLGTEWEPSALPMAACGEVLLACGCLHLGDLDGGQVAGVRVHSWGVKGSRVQIPPSRQLLQVRGHITRLVSGAVSSGRRNIRHVRGLRWGAGDRERCRRSRSVSSSSALIAQGCNNSEACRIVGINRRTGKRWRHGRTIITRDGRKLHYPPVVTRGKVAGREISDRYSV